MSRSGRAIGYTLGFVLMVLGFISLFTSVLAGIDRRLGWMVVLVVFGVGQVTAGFVLIEDTRANESDVP